MNGEVIKHFLVGLGFKVDEQGMKRFEGGIKNAAVAATALGAAAIAAAGMVTKFVTGVAKDFDAISDLGLRVNATAHEIMELGYVASLTDSSMEAVSASFDRFNRIAGEAVMGTGEGVQIFHRLGVSLREANGEVKNSAVLMREVGDQIRGLDRAQQSAVLEKLGIDSTMVQALTGDTAEIREEFRKMYEDIGVNANDAAQASSDFMDSTGRLEFVFDALKKAVALRFMPQIKRGIDGLRKAMVYGMPKIINTVKPVVDVIMRVAEAIVTLSGRVGQGVGVVLGWLKRVNDATDGLAGYVLAAAAAWKFLNLAFLASPIGIILSLAAAIALLVDDFMTWKEGGDSLIDWSAWEPPITAAINIISTLGEMITNTFGYITDVARALGQFLMGDFSGAWDSLGSAGQRIFDQFGFVVDIFTQLIGVIQWLAELLLGDLSAAWEAVGGVIDSVVGTIMRAVEAIASGASAVGDFASGAWEGTKSFFGFGDDESAAPALAPSPQAAATVSGGVSQNMQQKTEIVVNGSGTPAATAAAVGREQNRVNADMARNMAGAAR